MTGPAVRSDRIRRYVVAFCPRCHEEDPGRPLEEVRRLSGYLADRDGRVWLVRGCPTHGRITTLYEEDAEILDYLERWTAPTKQHTPDEPGNFDPVPSAYARGLGEMQTQHSCILLVDVTQRCNLTCPTCYAWSSPHAAGRARVEDVLANLDRRLARENGYLDVLMVSGGEPTVHPHLEQILEGAMARNVARILLNTNGLTLARDDRLLRFLERHNQRIEVYLQFDGFKESTHRFHRGEDLRAIKRATIDRLSGAGVFTTLVMTAQLGVNEDEIGAVVRLALETPFVGGVCVQPAFGSGRAGGIEPTNRLTGTGVLRRLGEQTGGTVTWRDLTALPCSHPHCSSVGYMILTDSRKWRSLVGLIGHDELQANIGAVSNRIVDPNVKDRVRELMGESVLGLLSNRASFADPEFRRLFESVTKSCDLGLTSLLRRAGGLFGRDGHLRDLLARRVKRLTVKAFQDLDTMIEERLLQCCVHVGTSADGRHQAIPFCAAQAWPRLARTKLAEGAANRVETAHASGGDL